MTTEVEPKSLVTRIREFFEMTPAEVRAEYTKLSDKDKTDFVDMFNAAGLPTQLKKA